MTKKQRIRSVAKMWITRCAPEPRMPTLGRVVARLRRRVDEPETRAEEVELDSIMTDARGWVP